MGDNSNENYGHDEVAPADRRESDGEVHEGVQPTAADSPVFPRPHGVSDEDLDKTGVAHAYAGSQPVEGDVTPSADVDDEAGSDTFEQTGDSKTAVEPQAAEPEADAAAE